MTSQLLNKQYDKVLIKTQNDSLQVINIFSNSKLDKKEKPKNQTQSLIKDILNKDIAIKQEEAHSQGADVTGFGEPKKKKKKDKHFLKTTLNTIHDNYYNVNLQEKNPKNIEVLNFAKKKIMTTILGFTNNLVFDDYVRYIY